MTRNHQETYLHHMGLQETFDLRFQCRDERIVIFHVGHHIGGRMGITFVALHNEQYKEWHEQYSNR